MRRYGSRNYGRRKPYKKRYVKNRGTNWAGLARKAFKTAKWVAGLVNAEYKFFEVNTSPTAVDYNGGIYALCYPAQGVTAETRNGDSIKIKNLTLRGQFSQNSTTTETVRMIIFIDKENETVAGSDLLEITGSSQGVFSPKNPNLRFDSKILLDKTYIINSNSPIKKFDLTLKIGVHTNFIATTTNASNNALKLLVIGQNASAGSKFQFYSRCTYLDN